MLPCLVGPDRVGLSLSASMTIASSRAFHVSEVPALPTSLVDSRTDVASNFAEHDYEDHSSQVELGLKVQFWGLGLRMAAGLYMAPCLVAEAPLGAATLMVGKLACRAGAHCPDQAGNLGARDWGWRLGCA